MFLHPVNVRCLVREYGSLEQSPEKISATVVEISGYSMSEVRACLARWTGREPHSPHLSVLGLADQVHRPSKAFSFCVCEFVFWSL